MFVGADMRHVFIACFTDADYYMTAADSGISVSVSLCGIAIMQHEVLSHWLIAEVYGAARPAIGAA